MLSGKEKELELKVKLVVEGEELAGKAAYNIAKQRMTSLHQELKKFEEMMGPERYGYMRYRTGRLVGKTGFAGLPEPAQDPTRAAGLVKAYEREEKTMQRLRREYSKYKAGQEAVLVSRVKNGLEIKKLETSLEREKVALEKSQRALRKVREEKDKVSSATIRMGGQTEGIIKMFSRLRNQLLVLTFATAGFRQIVMKSINEAVKFENSLVGLDSVARAFGKSTVQAKNAAVKLAEDGLMSVDEAARGLKNILATGLSMEQAIKLSERFKDIGAFNRQGTLSLGEAYVSASEGLKNQNCCDFDTEIFDWNTGKIKKIGEMHDDGEVPVITAVDRKTGKLRVIQSSYIHYNGESEIFELELQNRAKIRTTDNHRFITKRGMLFLCDLKEDDEILYYLWKRI